MKSTGPKTPEGKANSRANSIKHGLCASVVIPEDYDTVQARTSQWYYTLKPQTEYHSWLVDKISLYSLRIDRAERMERRLRDRKSMIAENGWEDERRLEAEILGGKIASKPAEVVEQLRQFPGGCDWLISRWSMLARLADVNQNWTPEQESLAFHLLGTPPELRGGIKPGESLDHDGRVVESVDDQASLARREIAGLIERREAVNDLDEVDRALTQADLFDESHPELKRVRRHENALHTRMRWCLAQFHYESPHIHPHPDLAYKHKWLPPDAPKVEAQAEAAPAVEPEPMPVPQVVAEPVPKEKRPKFEKWMVKPQHPPFCLDPHEVPNDGSKPDIGAIAVAREVARLKKIEARREVKRRKLERMRA